MATTNQTKTPEATMDYRMTVEPNFAARSVDQKWNPIDFGFSFTMDGWYQWDRKGAHKAALKARNTEAKKLRAAGRNVKTWTRSGQLITKGGIGTGHPQIEEIVNVYGLTVY
jgi:hypothetical protein